MSGSIPPAWFGLEDDYRARTDPHLLTALLTDAVPVLRFVSFRVVETRPGFCRCELPLSVEASNQHGVHQAAILGIAADYAGGVALGTLCHGSPIIGVHPQRDDDGASLWLVSLNVDYKRPSSSHATITAEVPADDHDKVKGRYNGGKVVLAKVPVTITDDGGAFAMAENVYFLRRARSLRPTSTTGRTNAMFLHKNKASARLIAALRGSENTHPTPLYLDQFADLAAGPHGKLLARRFLVKSPQLAPMVANRTWAVDQLFASGTFRQIVLIGAGYDLRPLRLAGSNGTQVPICFEVDLPEMLDSREQLIQELGAEYLPRVRVPLNLELESISEALLRNGFQPDVPTLFVYEGISMYLRSDANAKVFGELCDLARSSASRLWMDYVKGDVVRGDVREPAVTHFLDGMKALGEPFIWGLDDAAGYFDELGWRVDRDDPSDFARPSLDHIFDVYRFLTIRPES